MEPSFFNLCFLGFGNVNRTVVRLLKDRRQELLDRYGVAFRIAGIASRRLGWIADANGIDSATVLALNSNREGHDFGLEPALRERREPKGADEALAKKGPQPLSCLLYTSPSPRDPKTSRMPSSA